MKDKENQLTAVIEKVLRDTQNCDMSIETLTDYLVDRIKDKVFPKDSVVLSREEYEEMKTERQDLVNKYNQADEAVDYWCEKFKNASKETVEKIIAFIETLKVPEDGRHGWRDRHNDTIDRVILKLNQKFINGVE